LFSILPFLDIIIPMKSNISTFSYFSKYLARIMFVVPVSASYDNGLSSSVGETSVILERTIGKLGSIAYHYPAETTAIVVVGGGIPFFLLWYRRKKIKRNEETNTVSPIASSGSQNPFDEFNKRVG